MIKSWLKRQIILAALLVPLSSVIFILLALVINQFYQNLETVLNLSLLTTVFILLLVFIRLYQIKFFSIDRKSVSESFWLAFTKQRLLNRKTTLAMLFLNSIAVIAIINYPRQEITSLIPAFINVMHLSSLLIAKSNYGEKNYREEE
ncbi:MAG: hypothetical protein AAFO76_15325 [Cyanobacteria bacterium J06607_15]